MVHETVHARHKRAAAVWEQMGNAFANAGAAGGFLNDQGGPNSIEGLLHKFADTLATNSVPGGTASGTWHHYALLVDANDTTPTGIRLYLDGSPFGGCYNLGGTPSATPFLNATFFLGARSGVAFPLHGPCGRIPHLLRPIVAR